VTAQDVESSPVAVIPSGPRPGSEAAVAVALLSGNTNPEDQKNEGAPQSPAERRREGVHGKETSPVQQSAKTDAAGCTWTEIPPAPRASFPVQAARAGSDDSDMTSSLHPGQKLPAKESAAFAGANPPSQPAAAEFKALAALIGPRPGAVMQEPALISQLADRIQMQVRDGQEIVLIQLKPSSLGWIEVRAGSSSAGIVATIMTESAGVKAYLENNLHQLQQTFQDQGLKIDRINVVVQPDGWHQHASSAFQESRSGSGENGDAATSSRQGGISRQPAEEQIMDLPNTPALAPNSTFHTIA
jgi:flagellar hook-length control protein FliK